MSLADGSSPQPNSQAKDRRKLPSRFHAVLVGDQGVGKTTLLETIGNNAYPAGPVPSVFGPYSPSMTYNGSSYTLQITDTAGSSQYAQLRPLAYESASVFVLCFSCNLARTLESLTTHWIPEIRNTNTTAPLVLLGLQTDCRDLPEEACEESREEEVEPRVSAEEGLQASRDMGAIAYLEVSAKERAGDDHILESWLAAAINGYEPRSGSCTLS